MEAVRKALRILRQPSHSLETTSSLLQLAQEQGETAEQGLRSHQRFLSLERRAGRRLGGKRAPVTSGELRSRYPHLASEYNLPQRDLVSFLNPFSIILHLVSGLFKTETSSLTLALRSGLERIVIQCAQM